MTQAVLFHLAPANRGVIEAYLGRSGHWALLTDAGALEAPEIARHGAKAAALASLLPAKDLQEMEASIRGVLDKSPFLFAGKDWDALCSKHGVPPAMMRQAMRRDLSRDWGSGVKLVESLEQASRSHTIRAVVLDEEHSPVAGALRAWAGQRKIPILHIHAGMAWDGFHSLGHDLQADAIAVPGPHAAEVWQDKGLSAGRILQMGNPAWSKYSELAGIKAECRAGLAKLLGWGSGPLVVFGTGCAPIRSATDDPETLSQAARAFFQCARVARKIHPASIWTVLLRETDPPGLETVLQGWAAEAGLPPDGVHCFRNDAELFLAAAEVVISVDSSFIVEALLAGTPAINLLTDAGWRMGPSFAADTGVIEVPVEGLREEVLKALEKRPSDPRRLETARTAYQPAQTGDPVKNAVDWISVHLTPAA